MKAIDRPFTKIVNGTTQFVIPVFQRDYTWTESNCEQLFDDILSIASNRIDRGHFIGSIVYISTGDTAAGFTRWLLIDGQQRVTTLMLLFAALRQEGCPFCDLQGIRAVADNALAVLVRDAFPVTPGHLLAIPRRHVGTWFDLHRPEQNAVNELVLQGRVLTRDTDRTVAGFNVGINDGEVAGQTVPHCHVHLIPRRSADVENPRGGVRNVIPGKGDYVAS